ncbi:CPBP family intramembrane glutamic endopeptidase [Streptomyces specialis]|uniref:CPBP family intramembrane glutamic endopeptidase n=1 Tax=Streptomyces specialis TaxID=498367 RepID=UPI000A7CC9B0|nr:CPBP family intramembrane glutamic endopeptidase [Streptomyces specialis]
MAALILAGVLAWGLLADLLPVPALADQQAHLGFASDAERLAVYLWTSVVEELVCAAAVVVLLSAARRPLWEALVVAAVVRGVCHLYLGVGAGLGVTIVGAGAAWLFARYGRVMPLILVHLVYDARGGDALVSLGVTDRPREAAVTALAVVMAAAALRRLETTRRPVPGGPDPRADAEAAATGDQPDAGGGEAAVASAGRDGGREGAGR